MRMYPSITCDDLAAKIAFLSSGESPTFYENRLSNLQRRSNEKIESYAFRTKTYFDETLPAEEIDKLRESKWYSSQLLSHFLRGICNDSLRLEVRRQSATNIDTAVYIAKNMCNLERVASLRGETITKKLNN